MYWAQFFTTSANDPKKLIPACGDRAVIILDGRQSGMRHHETAMDEQDRRGFQAYQLMRGETFTRSEPLGGVYMSPEGTTPSSVARIVRLIQQQ